MKNVLAIIASAFILTGCASIEKLWNKIGKNDKEEVQTFPASVPNNGPDFSTWEQTTTIGNVRWESPGIRWDHIVEGNRNLWKVFGGDLNGHLVLLIQNSSGVWEQCLIDSIRPKRFVNGYDFQTLAPFKSHGNKVKGSLKGWSAKKGEKIGVFLVNGGWGYPRSGSGERSNAVWTTYPY